MWKRPGLGRAKPSPPKLPSRLPKALTIDQVTALLDAASGDDPQSLRDRALLELLYATGARVSEVVSLNVDDVFEEDIVRLRGKGNKERTVYLNKACILAIKRYMNVRPRDGVKDKDALFLSNRMTRISTKTVQHLVDTYLEKAGLGGQGFSVHKLRHTAATLMYQTGKVDVLELKELLGHESLNTTQIYTHIVNEKIKEAVDANPLSDFGTDK